MKQILILNGSIRGTLGNSFVLANIAKNYLEKNCSVVATIINLSEYSDTVDNIYTTIYGANGFLIITGTYWNNCGSPFQRFIEITTPLENKKHFLGKPIACLVSMDSVGGIDVINKIQTALFGFGCWSPPNSSLVISRVCEEVKSLNNKMNIDVWGLHDIDVVLDNLVLATKTVETIWRTWEVDNLINKDNICLEDGNLDMDKPKFL